MTYRSEREKGGFCRVFFVDGDARIRRNEYEPLCEALKRGDEWYEAVDLYDDSELIRLAAVVKVAEASPASIAAYDADCEERRAYDQTHGEG